jgi:hypothetical protein
MEALTALAKAALGVTPKLYAAFQNHAAYSDGEKKTSQVKDELKKTADKITATTLSGAADQRLDYLGLLAEWREMDICVDVAFAAIKDQLARDGETIDGMDDYKVALKKLAVRGETLVNALREAYEARSRYLLLDAEKKAREAAVAEVGALAQGVRDQRVAEAIAFMALRQRLAAQLAQHRRVVFNMLHEGVLALIYQANNVRLQKKTFGALSPALSITDLATQWGTFKYLAVKYLQLQDQAITVGAGDGIWADGWRDSLAHELEASFWIPPTMEKLKDKHHMRIKALHAEFVGLKRKDGTAAGLEGLEYTIRLGPLMLDRAGGDDASGADATVVQYYMARRALQKQGSKHELVDEKADFAKRAVCCMGKVVFKKAVIDEGWDLATVTDIRLHIKYWTLIFDEYNNR